MNIQKLPQYAAWWGTNNFQIGDTTSAIYSTNPATTHTQIAVHSATAADYDQIIKASIRCLEGWRVVPAPKRGALIKRLGELLTLQKASLAQIITEEVGKVTAEALGEVQEMIDICDFAVGLSRQLHGLTMHSERSEHRMYEQWHPLGVVGVITAFNFPMAVWAWNAVLAAVCGDTTVWKPSPKAPRCAQAVQAICNQVMDEFSCSGLFGVIHGDDQIGKLLASDQRVPLVSATGSVRMGRAVGQAVAARLGRSLLELGGNNAIYVAASADQDLALRAILFGAVGTAGQRCTSTRRVFLDRSIAKSFLERLVKAYGHLRIGDPSDPQTLVGPLIDQQAVDCMLVAINQAQKEGGAVLYGGTQLQQKGFFVVPTIVAMPSQSDIVREETFAPILYVMEVDDSEAAIKLNNAVTQGLSSAVFTSDLNVAERFLSVVGSDCGIANVNIGTSGAEIGGAFGGEKETGGGRESGSDAWKNYMRRQTVTINYSSQLPLAQGVSFETK